MIKLSVLGASGSIGRQALDVADWQQDRIKITALTAGSNWQLLAQQARKYRPSLIAVADETCYSELKAAVADLPLRVAAGPSGLSEAAGCDEVDTVLAAITGMAGLEPLLTAIKAGKRICLANKESLVAAGQLVMPLAAAMGVEIAPVDSEHSAIWQSLSGEDMSAVAQLILTASGGAFRDFTAEQLQYATPQQALQHPNWRMGAKITVDCATMVNKGLEIIEAHWLFDMPYDKIGVVVHPQSIVHSMVTYKDGSMKAQLAQADMRLPIQYALLGQQRPPTPVAAPNLADIGSLTFLPPDHQRFPALNIVRCAGELGGAAPCFINAANEELNAAFLQQRLPFMQISEGLAELLSGFRNYVADDLNSIFEADASGREAAALYLERHTRR